MGPWCFVSPRFEKQLACKVLSLPLKVFLYLAFPGVPTNGFIPYYQSNSFKHKLKYKV